MEITILGTRGNVRGSSRRHSRHSGVLIDGKILFDLGERSFLKYRPEHIFITHLHPDHAFFMEGGAGALEAPVYAPETSARLPCVKKFSGSMSAGSYRITSLPTVHSAHVLSAAYLIEKGGRSVLYTGDLVGIKKEYLGKLKSIDLVISDGSFMRRGGLVRRDKITGAPYGHNGIPDLIGFFRQYSKRIVFTHFGGWFFKDVAEAGRSIKSLGNGFKVDAAYDGMTIDI